MDGQEISRSTGLTVLIEATGRTGPATKSDVAWAIKRREKLKLLEFTS